MKKQEDYEKYQAELLEAAKNAEEDELGEDEAAGEGSKKRKRKSDAAKPKEPKKRKSDGDAKESKKVRTRVQRAASQSRRR